ncbi:alpha/beta hydrolase [Nocardioides limicola]|uniref:alpha/beta hydrolase n=1 Tax=Nocardioides limicola TaxID=2803368 RepID=UPI00193BF317|nr:alpha/beta hydrolase [Nocardioides sp. DJM-14]
MSVVRLRSVPDVSVGRAIHHPGGTLQSRAVQLGLRVSARPVIQAWSHTPFLPWPYELADQVGRLLPRVHGTEITDIDLPDCPGHVVRNSSHDRGRVIVYFQGGAFLVGGRHMHRHMISRIAQQSGASVIVPRFRKLPNHPVTSSIADGLAAYRHALDEGHDPADIALMGDSAGGYLTFMVTLAARREGLPVPGAITAMSPLIELDPLRRNMSPSGCTLFNQRAFRAFATLIATAHRRDGGRGPGMHSPSAGELAGLPPTLIQCSATESLYDDAARMTAALAAAGVDVELQVWDKQVHVFQAAAGLVPEATHAVSEVMSFLDRHVPGSARIGTRSSSVG